MRWNEIIAESQDITLPDWSQPGQKGHYALFSDGKGNEAKVFRSEHAKYIGDVPGQHDLTCNSLEELQEKLADQGYNTFVRMGKD